MLFDKQQIVSMIEQRLGLEQANQAAAQLPDQVDHEQHSGLLQQFGLDPQQLLGGERAPAGRPDPGYQQQDEGYQQQDPGYQQQDPGYQQDAGYQQDPGYQQSPAYQPDQGYQQDPDFENRPDGGR